MPMGDNVSRNQLEEELFSVRAMRHVFRVKRNMSLQGWVTLLNPVMRRGYPPQWAVTRDGDLTEITYPVQFPTPEWEAAVHAHKAREGTKGMTLREKHLPS